MTVAYVVIRPVVVLEALGGKIGFIRRRFIGTLVTNLGTVRDLKKLFVKVSVVGTKIEVI